MFTVQVLPVLTVERDGAVRVTAWRETFVGARAATPIWWENNTMKTLSTLMTIGIAVAGSWGCGATSAHTATSEVQSRAVSTTTGTGAGEAVHASGTYSLVVLPDQGQNAIYDFINTAKTSIDMTMYELRDTTVTTDLVAKEKAGVKVRVILDGKETSVNSAAYAALKSGGVAVTYSSTAFTYTHQKTVTVDGTESYISTGNLDTKYYSTSRDYGVLDSDANDVTAVGRVFSADFAETSITPGDGDDLVWSPTDSQTHLATLINGATKTLDVEQEEFSDPTLVNAVVAAAQRGVAVRVVAEDESGAYDSELTKVTAAGGTVTTYTSSTGYYIHAKAIVVDGTRVFLGSENFSTNSLTHNRELGLIISDSGVLTGVEAAFTADVNHTSATRR
jgi:phosphatidylserine/phosphatidylglycerophosphate/cardiolipin synthase-like enzyme